MRKQDILEALDVDKNGKVRVDDVVAYFEGDAKKLLLIGLGVGLSTGLVIGAFVGTFL